MPLAASFAAILFASQTPFVQLAAGPSHAWPHAPQFAASRARSSQGPAPSHWYWVPVHEVAGATHAGTAIVVSHVEPCTGHGPQLVAPQPDAGSFVGTQR
jgi:hypothetical protein